MEESSYPPHPELSPTTSPFPPQSLLTPPFNPAPQPPPPQKSKRSLIILISAAALACMVSIALYYFVLPKAQTCLTRADYRLISGEALPDGAPFVPTIEFHGIEIEFATNSTIYVGAESESQLMAVGQFVEQYPTTSLIVRIEGLYTQDTQTLTTERAAIIKNALIQSGIDEASITTKLTLYESGDSQDDTFMEDGSDTLSAIIASSETCR